MIIQINGLELPIRGGVSRMEDKLLQVIEVNLTLGVQAEENLGSLDLTETVDYVKVTRICKSVCEERFDLLENLAVKICNKIKANFQMVKWVEISVKKRPQLGLAFESVEVTYKLF